MRGYAFVSFARNNYGKKLGRFWKIYLSSSILCAGKKTLSFHFFPSLLAHQVIQVVPFSSPNVGGHLTPFQGSREFTIPKRSRLESPGHFLSMLFGGVGISISQVCSRSFWAMKAEMMGDDKSWRHVGNSSVRIKTSAIIGMSFLQENVEPISRWWFLKHIFMFIPI